MLHNPHPLPRKSLERNIDPLDDRRTVPPRAQHLPRHDERDREQRCRERQRCVSGRASVRTGGRTFAVVGREIPKAHAGVDDEADVAVSVVGLFVAADFIRSGDVRVVWGRMRRGTRVRADDTVWRRDDCRHDGRDDEGDPVDEVDMRRFEVDKGPLLRKIEAMSVSASPSAAGGGRSSSSKIREGDGSEDACTK
ncbi:hypothetical protein MRB53_037537 [Persea americana]|nr:hypothetical protein MRB53_037537 [Persea americana]